MAVLESSGCSGHHFKTRTTRNDWDANECKGIIEITLRPEGEFMQHLNLDREQARELRDFLDKILEA